jgi:divalent metal cation (Fe/Co/Zn/Cd) transporter
VADPAGLGVGATTGRLDSPPRARHDAHPAPPIVILRRYTRGVDGTATAARTATARLGRQLQYLTIAWNSVECLVALIAGFVAGSIALVGFGFDSAIEVASSLAALWRLRHDHDEARREVAERRALRVIGVCFLFLAAYVLYEAASALVARQPPDHSMAGIVLASLSLVVMPLLVRSKRRIATRLGSGALEAEAWQTRVCAFLSAILLAGLGLNAWLGWWWADPLAALGMVSLIVQEGWLALTGQTCCDD